MSGDIWKPVGREGALQYCALNPCLCYLRFPHKLSPVNLPLPSQISPSVLFFFSVPGQFLRELSLLINCHEVFVTAASPACPSPPAASHVSPPPQR